MLVDNIYVVLVSLSLLGIAVDRSFRWASQAFAKRYAPHL
jgi:ABC-type nitrate/sulfonate/bicarbonate transport system permease component